MPIAMGTLQTLARGKTLVTIHRYEITCSEVQSGNANPAISLTGDCFPLRD